MGDRGDLFETGIKSLDLFAPLRHGDLVRWDGSIGCGHVACLAELTRNALLAGYRGAVWAGFEDERLDERELVQSLSQLGERDLVAPLMASGPFTPESRREHIARVEDRLAALAEREPGRYLVVFFQDEGQMADPALAFPALNRRGEHAVTAICATPVQVPAPPPEAVALEPPVRARVVHDRRLVERRMFPAIHGLLTTSLNLVPGAIGDDHLETATAARELMERYLALDPDLYFPDLFVFPKSERDTVTRGQRLCAYLAQPFSVNEAFSGIPGERVPLEQTLRAVSGLLAGELDDVPFRQVLFSGRMPESPRRG